MRKSPIHKAIASALPQPLRTFLGKWTFEFYRRIVCPILGLLFDLRGGRFKVDGCEIEVPKELTTRTYRSSFMTGEYEAEERSLLRKYLNPEDSVLELGACIGVVACVTNRLLKNRSNHVVVEGNPKLISSIQRNKEINNSGFTILNKAVSQENEVTFYLHEDYIVGGTAQRKSAHPVKVEGITLDDLDQIYGPFSAVIMDIEGGEADSIPHALNFLKKCRVVIWETHDWACGTEATELCRKTLIAAGLTHVETEVVTEAWLRL